MTDKACGMCKCRDIISGIEGGKCYGAIGEIAVYIVKCFQQSVIKIYISVYSPEFTDLIFDTPVKSRDSKNKK